MPSSGGLVPDDIQDFRSSDFWDGFFRNRGDKPFEWYGDWRQLKPLAAPLCCGRRILMLGCGNSELSADMYDDGIEDITNIDFVPGVVRDMMRKNLRRRPRMRWQVQDMTAMKFPDASFDVAFDKGGLDALMGDESSDADTAGVKLLEEVSRVLDARSGAYICVTLAQAHVLRILLTRLAAGWRTSVHKVPPPPDMAQSPLQPLVVVAARDATAAGSAPPPVQLGFNAASGGPDAEQLADVVKVVREVNAWRASSATSSSSAPQAAASSQARGPSRPSGSASMDAFADLHPGGSMELEAAAGAKAFSAGSSPPPSAGSAAPRFRAAVIDLDSEAAQRAVRDCAVFIVPQGREQEWLFGSAEGQRQLAGQCASRRVIIVSLGRGHRFPALPALQAELSPLVLPLATAAVRAAPKAVPFMTAGEGVGRRTPVAQADSQLSGPIAVEDVTVSEGGADKVLRRMVFTANRNLIQSEAVLVAAPAAGSKRGVAQQAAATGSAGTPTVDHAQLPCEYHQAIVAGLALASARLEARAASGAGGRALVVGLGGGGLPAFLASHCRLAVEVAELDPVVVRLAREHFGLPQTQQLQVRIQDGLQTVAEAAAGQYDVIVVDAGSGDASLAMSCPPAAFLAPDFLAAAHAALAPGGLLAVNCVTRSDTAFQGAFAALEAAFPQLHALEVQEDVNRVLFGISAAEGGRQQSAAGKKSAEGRATVSRAALKVQLRRQLLGGSKEQTSDIVDMLDSLTLC